MAGKDVLHKYNDEMTDQEHEDFADVYKEMMAYRANTDEKEELLLKLNKCERVLPKDEFVFHCNPLGEKPEENQAYSDRISECLKHYCASDRMSEEEKKYGTEMFDRNFYNKVDFDNIYINGRSVNKICADFGETAIEDIEFKKTMVTAAAIGRKDKLDVRLPDPETGALSKPIAMRTNVRDEMKKVSFWGEVKSFFDNIGDSKKRGDAIKNIKTILGLENTKDEQHLQDLKRDVREKTRDARHEMITEKDLKKDSGFKEAMQGELKDDTVVIKQIEKKSK
jgi:hypothetical protein